MAFTSMQIRWGRYRIALHKEKSKVRQCIQQVQRDLYAFRKKFFLHEANDSHPVVIKEFLLHNKINRQISDDDTIPALSSNNFLKWIEAKAISLYWSKQFLDELKKIAIRASYFETLISQSLRQLKNTYEEHISKYCRSFIDEVNCPNVKVPHNYERNIKIWTEQIQRGQAIICEKITQLKDLEEPFYEYLNNYQQVTSLMFEILDYFPEILQPMSRWLLEDDGYIRKLQNELYSLTRRKVQIEEVGRSQQFRVTEAQNNFQRKTFISQLLWRDVKSSTDELKEIREQQDELKNTQQEIEYEQLRKKVELADAQAQFKNRATNSSTLYDILVEQMENRQQDIQKLNLSRNQGSIELSRILKAKVKCDIKLCVANSKYESSLQVQQEHENIYLKEMKALIEIKDSLKDVQNKMDALQQIKELKTESLTVQTLFEKPQINGFENNEALNDALNLVANEIGLDWICLYQILPFEPPRSIRMRIGDIEDIKQMQLSTQEMALEALQKWKQLSKDCSVAALANLLDRLGKSDVIMQLKKHLLINN